MSVRGESFLLFLICFGPHVHFLLRRNDASEKNYGRIEVAKMKLGEERGGESAHKKLHTLCIPSITAPPTCFIYRSDDQTRAAASGTTSLLVFSRGGWKVTWGEDAAINT